MCGSSPSPPPDRSVELRQLEIQEERRRAEEERLRKEEELRKWQDKLSGAYTMAQEDARANLSARGLQESEFMPIIMRQLEAKRTGIPELDPDPYSFFSSAADGALMAERDRRRANYTNTIDKFAPFGFADTRISNNLDDDLISGLIDEDYNRALTEAERARDRGVITDVGLQGVTANLGRQRSGINARLQDTGAGILEEGRQTLRNRANSGRQAASMYELGQVFNPLDTENLINQDFTNFRTALADRFRSKVGDAPLFNTSDLFTVAGQSQGAQNTKNVGDVITKPEEDENRGLGTTGAF